MELVGAGRRPGGSRNRRCPEQAQVLPEHYIMWFDLCQGTIPPVHQAKERPRLRTGPYGWPALISGLQLAVASNHVAVPVAALPSFRRPISLRISLRIHPIQLYAASTVISILGLALSTGHLCRISYRSQDKGLLPCREWSFSTKL